MKSFKVLFLHVCLLVSMGFIFSPGIANAKTYDLVLIHGFCNMQKWSDGFLDTALKTYGSGNVYVLYTDGTSDITTRTINGRKLYLAGGNNSKAGTDHIAVQAGYVKTLITKLQAGYGLSSSFSMIAHSMGGLVAREYAVENPGKVADIVDLGTPNQGGHIFTNWYDHFVGYFLGADKACDDMRDLVSTGVFNAHYPVSAIQFANNGKLYYIRTITNIFTCGSIPIICEMRLFHEYLCAEGYPQNDGMSVFADVAITGGIQLASYANKAYSHYDLVIKSDVAAKAISVLR
jgi:triacylglycerol lipase